MHTKKEKKLSDHFWEIQLLSEKLTPTTDDSALEKLRCLSAGGANKRRHRTIHGEGIEMRCFSGESEFSGGSTGGGGSGGGQDPPTSHGSASHLQGPYLPGPCSSQM